MNYNRARRALTAIAGIVIVVAITLSLIACGGGASGTVNSDGDPLPTAVPQVNQPLTTDLVIPTPVAVLDMPVQTLSKGEQQVTLEESTVTLYYTEVLLTLSDGSQVRCVHTIYVSFNSTVMPQLCEFRSLTTDLVIPTPVAVLDMPVQTLSKGEQQVTLEESTVTLYYTEVLLTLSDGSQVGCVNTIYVSFNSTVMPQLCEFR